ncbi:MAG: TIGR03617 family F420-dependent LLM class oxidoreductase [Actinomycetota bacterium]
MRVDYYYPPGSALAAGPAAERASRIGYDGFMTAETSHDPFLPLVVAAGAAPELELGTSIAVAFPRSPMVTAMTAWDLAQASGGKFTLGLGTQVKAHITRRFSVDWDSPGPRLRDYVLALRAIWDAWATGERLHYEGEFYRFSLMTPFFDPGPIGHPHPPVAIAGVGPYLSRLAGEICDGLHIHPFHTIDYLDRVLLSNLADGAREAGRSRDDCRRIVSVFAVTGATQSDMERSLAAVKQQIAFYASTPSYAPVLEASGWDFGPKLTAMSKRGEWDRMAEVITDEVAAEVGVVAPLDDLGEAIRVRYGDRVHRVGLYNLGAVAELDDGALQQVISDLKGS